MNNINDIKKELNQQMFIKALYLCLPKEVTEQFIEELSKWIEYEFCGKLSINEVMDEMDRLVRTKQIDMVHINLEQLNKNLEQIEKYKNKK